jgi:hypothetical protein
LVVDRVTDRTSRDRSDERANEGAGGSVAASAVVADDSARKRSESGAVGGALLGVWARADAAGEGGAKSEGCGCDLSFHESDGLRLKLIPVSLFYTPKARAQVEFCAIEKSGQKKRFRGK